MLTMLIQFKRKWHEIKSVVISRPIRVDKEKIDFFWNEIFGNKIGLIA